MDPIDFRVQGSKVKVTINIYVNKLVDMIDTRPLCATSPNLADMLAIVRGWTLLILEVRGQRSRSQLTYMEMNLWTRYRLNRCVLFHFSYFENKPYWFWGHGSKVKITRGIFYKCGVRREATLSVAILYSVRCCSKSVCIYKYMFMFKIKYLGEINFLMIWPLS